VSDPRPSWERKDWTPERIEQLSSLWDTGLSAQAIGREMGLSKNSIVGKARRLKLTPRPSPIKLRDGGPIVHVPPAPKTTLPGFDAPGPAAAKPAVVAPVRVPQPAVPVYARVMPCQYIAGGRPFVMCRAPSIPGRPYCREHYLRCTVPAGKGPGAPVDYSVVRRQ
jgi:GcrA cell cycle regulator